MALLLSCVKLLAWGGLKNVGIGTSMYYGCFIFFHRMKNVDRKKSENCIAIKGIMTFSDMQGYYMNINYKQSQDA